MAEYIIHGANYLYHNCAEPSDTIINSINTMAKELFQLIKSDSKYINSLSDDNIKKLQEFMVGYYSRDESIQAYRDVSL